MTNGSTAPEQATFTPAQVMMTLAALAATAPDERPSGESLAQQQERILHGINTWLLDHHLATAGQWQALWVGLSQDRANLAFIAKNTQNQNEYAVSIRGTQFTSLIDLGEDLEPGTIAMFTPNGSAPPLPVSAGSMKAFTEITSAFYTQSGANLLQELLRLVGDSQTTLYITGHSLGGAMATMVALYLWAQNWSPSSKPTFIVYTFAAPTAGLEEFATYYDQQLTNNPPNQTWRYCNAWDVVPNAWQDLVDVENNFYPHPPGPKQSIGVQGLLKEFLELPNNNKYVQTNRHQNRVVLNHNYVDSYDHAHVCQTTGDFFAQVAFQHNSYLQLLKAPVLPPPGAPNGPPVVKSLSPNYGWPGGGTMVEITGTGFEADSVVDFGTLPGTNVQVISPTTIQVTAPTLAGIVDVRVTTKFGTSAAIPADQFAALQPGFAPVLFALSPFSPAPPAQPAISPTAGPTEGGTLVTITGFGFTTGSDVFFGDVPATEATVVSMTEIQAVSPPYDVQSQETVGVVVQNVFGKSVSTAQARFSYNRPVVTSITPCCGNSQTLVVVKGAGFKRESQVLFGKKNATIVKQQPWEITVNPPSSAVPQTVSVTVVNGNLSSDGNMTATQFSYIDYNPEGSN